MEPSASPRVVLDTPAEAEPDSHFRIASEDGRNELVIEGLFQVTASAFDKDRVPDTDFAIKRMRPEFSGHVNGGLHYKLEPKFTEDEVELEEAWVGPKLFGGRAQLMLGRMKAPFGLEEVRSRRHIDFASFSLINQFSPAEDHGVFLNGDSPSGVWEYGLAAYNGTGSSDNNSSKDLAGRIMVHPFADSPGSTWEHLAVGLAATIGSQDSEALDLTIDNEAGSPVVRFAPDARLDGERQRLGLELSWHRGPWFFQGEAMLVEQRMRGAGGALKARASGGYVTLSHALTGEAKSFGGVEPASPFDFQDGSGRGAWVLALRYTELTLDSELADVGLVLPGSFTDHLRSISLGVNWIPNTNAIVRTAWVQSLYDDEVAFDTGSGDEEGALVIEFQLHF